MKIYFAGSITGGRGDVEVYSLIINHLKTHGTVLTEHVGDSKMSDKGETSYSDVFVHDRDFAWVLEADVLVAEVTTPSLGVGYEIGRAVEHGKKVLCLYRKQEGKKLSRMISGCRALTLKEYSDINSAKKAIDEFFREIK